MSRQTLTLAAPWAKYAAGSRLGVLLLRESGRFTADELAAAGLAAIVDPVRFAALLDRGLGVAEPADTAADPGGAEKQDAKPAPRRRRRGA